MEEQVVFEPLDNGLDYMDSVVEHLFGDPGPRDLKYAILHLAAGIEVLLKARLAIEHWSLIFRVTDKATRSAYDSGDFESVSADKAIERLEGIIGLTFSEEAKKSVRRVVAKRNRLQHHGLTDSVQAVTSAALDALNVLLDFVAQHLRGDLGAEEPRVEGALAKVRESLFGIQDFVSVRMRALEADLDAIAFSVECPSCGQEALVPDAATGCLYCFARAHPEEMARQYVEIVLGETDYEVVKDGGTPSLRWCPSCGQETLVAGAVVRKQAAPGGPIYWVCFAEGEGWRHSEIGECDRCGAPTLSDEEEGMSVCADCWDYGSCQKVCVRGVSTIPVSSRVRLDAKGGYSCGADRG